MLLHTNGIRIGNSNVHPKFSHFFFLRKLETTQLATSGFEKLINCWKLGVLWADSDGPECAQLSENGMPLKRADTRHGNAFYHRRRKIKIKKKHYYSPSNTSHTVYCRLTTAACPFLPRQAKLKSSVKMDLDRDGGAWTVPPQALQIVTQKHATDVSCEPAIHAFLGDYCSSAPGESRREDTGRGAVTAALSRRRCEWAGALTSHLSSDTGWLSEQTGTDHGYVTALLLLPNGI